MEIPRLHPDTIEEVKQRVDIVDVISDYVVLRKRGKDYLGLCPFHQEKTPSFSVSHSKQVYYCFGCGAGGNAFKFLMELGKQSFSDVVFDLAQRYQIPIATLEPTQKQELQRQLTLREQLYEILALTASFYQHALRQPQGERSLNYLKTERNLSEETIQKFQLGYAPAGWETLYRYLVEVKRYSLALVEQAGLIKKRKSGEGYYDRFRDRLTIPIHDTQGRIIGFGSRTLGDEQPKYLNSPETRLFDKSKTLFALHKARDSISKQDRAVVVEGYFDAIALHAAGITNAVASLGTAFTQDQLRQILRYTQSKQVILNFDADSAGTQATQRAIGEIESLVYSGQVQLRILNLPDGKDADEFLKTTPQALEIYRQSILEAPLWLDWQINQLLIGRNLKQADQFQQVAKNIVKLLSKIDNKDLRTHYIARSAELFSQGDAQYFKTLQEDIHLQVRKQRRKKFNNSKNAASDPPIQALPVSDESNLLAEAEANLLRIYLHYPEYRQKIIAALQGKDLLFNLSHHRFLWQQIIELQELTIDKQSDPSNKLLSQLQARSANLPEQINQVSHLLYLNEKLEKKEKIEKEDILRLPVVINSAIATLELVACEKYRNYCLEQWQKLYHTNDRQNLQYYYQEFLNAEAQLKELKKQRLAQAKDYIL